MKKNYFSKKFLDYFNIKSINEPVISQNGVVLSRLVFVAVSTSGANCGYYFYSPSHFKWLYKHNQKCTVMSNPLFSHFIGIQVL